MFRYAFLALAALLFLVPGNLAAAVLQASLRSCEEQCCGCPVPAQDTPGNFLTERCCCETQPAPAPEDRPANPLQAPQETPAAGFVQEDGSCVVPCMAEPSDVLGERPGYLAQAPPGPLFLRYHNLRL